ncbi:MAG: 30S ribosomal protein S20 [Chlamydiae bacterium]|nr:30S ribosomal protein S20 [Chlamydiota bacterium]
MAEEKKDSKTKCPTAKKRDIQNAKRRLHNRSFKSRMKTAVRSFENEVTQKNETEAKACLNTVFSLLDKGVKMGIYKLNKVSRLKSSFSGRI